MVCYRYIYKGTPIVNVRILGPIAKPIPKLDVHLESVLTIHIARVGNTFILQTEKRKSFPHSSSGVRLTLELAGGACKRAGSGSQASYRVLVPGMCVQPCRARG